MPILALFALESRRLLCYGVPRIVLDSAGRERAIVSLVEQPEETAAEAIWRSSSYRAVAPSAHSLKVRCGAPCGRAYSRYNAQRPRGR